MTGAPDGGAVFVRYADFYDAFYADKDYDAETDFLVGVFDAHRVARNGSVLDLGSGTGGHALPLAARGYSVVGVDRSAEMVRVACAKAAESAADVDFRLGDVRDADLSRTFNAVISMFAVIGYQLSNADLAAMFATARRHLQPGGLFVFDGWFGPTVLSERPEDKTKVVTSPDGGTITRVARPTLDIVRQTVRVDYEVTARSAAGDVERTSESHEMRFLFAQEIARFLELAGFELVEFGPFADLSREITLSDWNFSAVARAV